jgi:hypothetical protein
VLLELGLLMLAHTQTSNSHYEKQHCSRACDIVNVLLASPTESEALKQTGWFDTIVSSFRQVLESLPDKRTGKNSRYGMEDAALSAFSVLAHHF